MNKGKITVGMVIVILFTIMCICFEALPGGYIPGDPSTISQDLDLQDTQKINNALAIYALEIGGTSASGLQIADDGGNVAIKIVDGGTSQLGGNMDANSKKIINLEKTIQFTVMQPDDMDETDDIIIFANNTGGVFTITEIKAWSDTDDATFTLVETSATDLDTETTIEAITISTDGTGVYYTTVASGDIDNATIADGNMIVFDPSTDDVNYIKVMITGKFTS